MVFILKELDEFLDLAITTNSTIFFLVQKYKDKLELRLFIVETEIYSISLLAKDRDEIDFFLKGKFKNYIEITNEV